MAPGNGDRVGEGQDREHDQGAVAPGRPGGIDRDRRTRLVGSLDQGSIAEMGEQPEARGAQGAEDQEAAGRAGQQAHQDDRPEGAHGEVREQRPVDEREVLGDPLGCHDPSVR